MKFTKTHAALAAVSLITLAAAAKPASGAILLSDNFDSYADQAAFNVAWPAIGTSGTLSTTQSVTAPNSIHNSTAAHRNQATFTESGTPSATNPITFSFDFYDSNATASPYRHHTNLQDGTGPTLGGQLIAMGLNNNMFNADDGGNYYMARVLGYDGSAGAVGGDGPGTFFKLNQGAAPLRSTGWHNLQAVITDTDIKFYVDGILSATEVTSIAASRSFDVVRLGSGLTATQETFYDNVFVGNEPVPEPTSLTLLALGGLALIRRRKSR
jgi:hypothetical protein